MSLFPANPTNGQQTTVNGILYTYNSSVTAWDRTGSAYSGDFSVIGTITGTSSSASALTIGANGSTNPVLKIDASSASVATGLSIKGAASAAGLALSVISSGTNENLTIDAKGSGTLTLNGTATGGVTISRALTYGGVTLSNSVTGTGSMVLSASPTFTGLISADRGTFSGTLALAPTNPTYPTALTIARASGANSISFSNTLTIVSSDASPIQITPPTTFAGALTYGGVTLSNAVTGTGNMVLSASPTLTGTLTAAAGNFSGNTTVGGVLILGSGGVDYFQQITPGARIDTIINNVSRTQTTSTGFSVTGTLSASGALTYGGVTLSNSVTGTGSMVLSINPTFTASAGANPALTIYGANYSLLNIRKGTDATSGGYQLLNAAGTQQWFVGCSENTNNHVWYNAPNNAFYMTLDTSGNLGIGTASPTRTLQVVGTAAFSTSGVSFASSASIGFFNSSPHDGANGYANAQFGQSLNFLTNTATNSADCYIMCGAYYDSGGWRHQGTGIAALYGMNGGAHTWYTAPAGTANATFNWTTLMTLSAGGYLLIGTTTATSVLSIVSATSLIGYYDSSAANGAYSIWANSGTQNGVVGSAKGLFNGTLTDFGIRSENNLIFGIGSSEKMRLDTSGRLGIGKIPSVALDVYGQGSFMSDSSAPAGSVSASYLFSSSNSANVPVMEIRQGRYNQQGLVISTNQTNSSYFLQAIENGTSVFTIGSGGATYAGALNLFGPGSNTAGSSAYVGFGITGIGGYFVIQQDASRNLAFFSNNGSGYTQNITFTGAGTLLVGTASATISGVKTEVYSTVNCFGAHMAGNANAAAIYAQIDYTAGQYMNFLYGGVQHGYINDTGSHIRIQAANALLLQSGATYYVVVDGGAAAFYPAPDNTMSCGYSSLRWTTVYATTGSINTSARATKTEIRSLDEIELAVAKRLASNIRVYKLVASVVEKGIENARLHTGQIYEDVVEAFEAEGLDPHRYSIVCRDEKQERIKVSKGFRTDVGEDGKETKIEEFDDVWQTVLDEYGDPVYIYALRYDELAQFIFAGMNARLLALEEKVN